MFLRTVPILLSFQVQAFGLGLLHPSPCRGPQEALEEGTPEALAGGTARLLQAVPRQEVREDVRQGVERGITEQGFGTLGQLNYPNLGNGQFYSGNEELRRSRSL